MAMAGFIADGLDAYPGYDRCAAPHWIGSVPPSTVPDTSSAPGGGIHPLAAPFRMLDTRPLSGKLGAGRSLTVPIVARGGVSPTATSVLATITTTEGCADSFVTAYPCGAGVPTTSVVNALTNTTVANGVLVKLSGSGALCIYANAPVDVIVDVAAWIGPSGAAPTPVTPDRLVDSRPGFAQTLDLPQQRLAAGTTLDVPIGALPAAAGAAAVAVNLTAVDPGGDGYLTVFPGPCSATPPLASNVNVTAGHTTAAGATSAVGGGSICVYTSVATDVVVDLDAVYGPGATSVVTTAPKRLFDTRDTTRVDAGATIEIDLDDPALGAPPTATGIVANLTATGPSSDGYLTMYPCGTALPNVSNLNVTGGHTVANLAISGAGIGRRICIFSLVTTDVLLDREGWITG
jgi:hypothetical protein